MRMYKIIPIFAVAGALVVLGWLAWGSMNTTTNPALAATTTQGKVVGIPPISYECNGDAKVCPDGSTVGRTGTNCAFAACPTPEATSATIRTTLGQTMTGLNVTITPTELVDDSRCPTDVQCIWAGTAHVRATISTNAGTTSEVLEIGQPIEKDGYTITFTELSPSPKSDEVTPSSSYRFVFTVSKSK